MTSLDQLQVPPDESLYDSWEEARAALQEWAVKDNPSHTALPAQATPRFAYITPRKDVARGEYVCAATNCPWHVTATKTANGQIRLRVVERAHNPSSPHARRSAALSWLLDTIPKILPISPATTPQDIAQAIRAHYDERVDYQQAYRCLQQIAGDIRQPRHRINVPDSLRKAVITLRAFQGLDWADIERKTGVKATTAAYIYKQAHKKSGFSTDPLRLLEHSAAKPGGPAPGNDLKKMRERTRAKSKQALSLEFARQNLVAMHAERERVAAAGVGGVMPEIPGVDVAMQLAGAADGMSRDRAGEGGAEFGAPSSGGDSLFGTPVATPMQSMGEPRDEGQALQNRELSPTSEALAT
ncbi:MAG: hypothetical protein LQ340_000793 [Diploschistes diacapsis]|nr:MAG: hypothetical protein LQ340_000793 [Diploschistes diacapsis]